MKDDGEPRTYGIWWFALGFVALGVIGLMGFLVLGSSSSPTVQLPGSSTTEAPTTTAAPVTAAPVTIPGGAVAPDGVSDVVSTGGTTTYSFSMSDSVAQSPYSAAVPPTTATPAAGDTGLDLTISCAGTSGDVLAEITVTETPTSIVVLPVVLVPANAPPCTGLVLRTLTVPLTAPLAGRPVDVVAAGTPVPTPAAR